jgi:large subunit ribosomal protein L30
MAKKKTNMLKIKYVRSAIGRPKTQKSVVRGLGFRKLQQVVERPDTPEIRGMINKVGHLVEIIEGDES